MCEILSSLTDCLTVLSPGGSSRQPAGREDARKGSTATPASSTVWPASRAEGQGCPGKGRTHLLLTGLVTGTS